MSDDVKYVVAEAHDYFMLLKESEALRAENERLRAFIADRIHDATVERMMLEVQR